MSEPQKYHVGQQVIMREKAYRGPRVDKAVEISRVGRKYVYVQQGWQETAFHISSGMEAGTGSYRSEIGTEEDFATRDALVAAQNRLADLTRGYSWYRDLTTGVLTQIADLIEGVAP